MLPYVFVSTLPRSGSTLLMNLLAQNPAFHVTPTNDLIELVVGVRNNWIEQISFKAQGINTVKPRIVNLLRGMFDGFFKDELAAGKTIFDKSRGWFAYIELLEEIFQEPVKLICTIRSVKEIVASFEKLDRQSKLTKPKITGDEFFKCQTTEGRARSLLDKTSVLGLAINRFRDVYTRSLADRMIVIPYNKLVEDPQSQIDYICGNLGLPTFKCNSDNVLQVTKEDDAVHGMELHTIRNKVDRASVDGWKGVIPERLAKSLDIEYADIESML